MGGRDIGLCQFGSDPRPYRREDFLPRGRQALDSTALAIVVSGVARVVEVLELLEVWDASLIIV